MSLQLRKVEMWDAQDLQRFEASIEYRDEEECWLWTGATNGKAAGHYPVFNFYHDGQPHLVMPGHVLYDRLIEKLPRDRRIQLRRTCGNRKCVNPHHRKLFAVGKRGKKGKKRGPKKRTQKKRPTTCAKGHDLTRAGATYNNPSSGRRCRQCKLDYEKKYRERNREARLKEYQERKENWAELAQQRLEEMGA